MVHAVRVPANNSIYFVMGEATAKPGWTVEPGAWLDVPSNAFYASRGQRPKPAICRGVADPLHYKIYMDPEQAEPEEWTNTGLYFGGTFSVEDWDSYSKRLPEGEPVPLTVSDEKELEAYNNAMRHVRGYSESCLD